MLYNINNKTYTCRQQNLSITNTVAKISSTNRLVEENFKVQKTGTHKYNKNPAYAIAHLHT